MFSVMRRYFDQRGFEADWDQIERSDDNAILNTLAMVCPFDVAEKQALLEAEGMSRRADLLVAMMEMALHEDDGQNDARH
ncbi:MAG: peptidase S16, partial [Candidatus Puniceispirillaceae bacterium]|jgi:Lon protease-like protein